MNSKKLFPEKSLKIFIFLFILILPFFSYSSSNIDAELTGGFAKINITPDVPVQLAGYASRKELSQGIHDSLFARAVVIKKKNQKIVLISTDLIGFYGGTAKYIRSSLLEKFKLSESELYLCAIHTHSGPSLTLNTQVGHSNNFSYTEILKEKLITLVEKALKETEPVVIGSGVGSCPVGVNRRELTFDATGNSQIKLGRNPGGISDKEVLVIKVTKPVGGLRAVIFDYATHSTALGPKNYIISGDVHGLAEQFIENYLGQQIIAPAFAGASGDIDPWYRILPSFRTAHGWIPEPMLLGTFLGEEVVRVLESIKENENVDGINTRFSTLKLPAKTKGELEIKEDLPLNDFNITVGRIGKIAIVGLGGEVLSEVGMAIKAASPFKHTLVITHCNDAAGYLPPKHLYLEGGYEIRTSPFAPAAAEIVIKEVVKLLHEI